MGLNAGTVTAWLEIKDEKFNASLDKAKTKFGGLGKHAKTVGLGRAVVAVGRSHSRDIHGYRGRWRYRRYSCGRVWDGRGYCHLSYSPDYRGGLGPGGGRVHDL